MDEDIRDLIKAISSQTQAIGALAQSIGATHVDHEARLRKLEEISIQLKERMSLWQVFQASYTTAASAVAGVVAALIRR